MADYDPGASLTVTKLDKRHLDNFWDTGKTRKESKSHIYLIAALAGIIGAAVLIFGLQLAWAVIKAVWGFLVKYYIWVIVGLIGLLFLRKLLKKKKIEKLEINAPGYEGYPGY